MGEAPPRAHTILVIDDDERIRDFVDEVLTRSGYAVVQATNGSEGLAAFDRHGPDLILLDLTMPDMRGEEVLSELRRRAPQCRVLLATGFSDGEAVEEQADGVLDKPFSIAELVRAVAGLLQ